MKTIKSFRSISVSFLTISVMLIALACGGDSDDGGNDGTGGTATATGGSSGGGSGTGGTTTSSGTGGTTDASGGSGGSMDASQPDGMAEPEPLPQNVAAGGECTMPYAIAGAITLFTSYGVCQNASDPCVGGTPDQFDLAPILPAGSETFAGLLPPPEDPAANCASGLVCCIREDQCQEVGASITGGVVAQFMPGISVSCQAAGSCTATNEGDSAGELTTGCPTGQTCCVVMPAMDLEAGIPGLTPDATTPAADAGAGQ